MERLRKSNDLSSSRSVQLDDPGAPCLLHLFGWLLVTIGAVDRWLPAMARLK